MREIVGGTVQLPMRIWQILSTVVMCAHAAACAPHADVHPRFVERLIAELGNGEKWNPPGSIWRYTYEGRDVYYVPPHCCDVTGTLYDREGNVLCAPDGGITGAGDGRCPDFFAERRDEHLIWADPR